MAVHSLEDMLNQLDSFFVANKLLDLNMRKKIIARAYATLPTSYKKTLDLETQKNFEGIQQQLLK